MESGAALGHSWCSWTSSSCSKLAEQRQYVMRDRANSTASLPVATRFPSICALQSTSSSRSVTLYKDFDLRRGGRVSWNWSCTRRSSPTIMRATSDTCLSSLSKTSLLPDDHRTTTYNNDDSSSSSGGASNNNVDTLSHMTPPMIRRPREDDEANVQEMTVYEINELDRGSPVLLSLSKLATDWYDRFCIQPLGRLGDLVPFSNKTFDGTLKKRLGITAGMISVIRHYPDEDALLFEAVYSFYFGDFGHISVKGAYRSDKDTVLTVNGGSGIFRGVYGTVHLHNVEYPRVLFYRFRLHGIPRLPSALQWDTLPPTKGMWPSLTASLPGFALPNFTD